MVRRSNGLRSLAEEVSIFREVGYSDGILSRGSEYIQVVALAGE